MQQLYARAEHCGRYGLRHAYNANNKVFYRLSALKEARLKPVHNLRIRGSLGVVGQPETGFWEILTSVALLPPALPPSRRGSQRVAPQQRRFASGDLA